MPIFDNRDIMFLINGYFPRHCPFVIGSIHKDCGVSLISNYRKQLNKANEALARDQQQMVDLECQIQRLMEKKACLSQQIEADITNVVTKGMLHFDEEKRRHLLNEAAQLSYSQLRIEKINRLNDCWNADHVNFETITELQAIERYVGKNSPGLLSQLGKFMLGGGNQ